MNRLRTKLEEGLGRGLLVLLLLGCLLVVWPFVTALLWAAILSFALWPTYARLLKVLSGRRTLAALIIALGMVLAVVLPLGLVSLTLGQNVNELKTAASRWLDARTPDAPAAVGETAPANSAADESWISVAGDSAKLRQKARPLVEPVASWILRVGMKLGVGLFQLALSVLLTFLLLRHGPQVAETLTQFVGRISGERGAALLIIAGNTVRGVVYGILGTALVQGAIAGVGLFIAGVPGAALLAVLTFLLSVVPLGPFLVLIPAALWLFHQGETSWGVFMLVWAAIVNTVDNFVKPWLISQGSDMPFILILFGVLGGAIAFGFIGVFLGPTLLAVGYRVIAEWPGSGRTPTTSSPESVAGTAGTAGGGRVTEFDL